MKKHRDAILSQVAHLSDRDEIDTYLREIDWLKKTENLKSLIRFLSIIWRMPKSQKRFDAKFAWSTKDDLYSILSKKLEYRNAVLNNTIKYDEECYFDQVSLLLLESCDTDKVLKTLNGISTQTQIDFYVQFTFYSKLLGKTDRKSAEKARIEITSLFLTGNGDVDKTLFSSLSEIESDNYSYDSERICKIHDVLAKFWNDAGRDFYSQGMFEKSKSLFERLLIIDNNPDTIEILASVYQKIGNHDQAEKLLKRALIMREKDKIRQCEHCTSKYYVRNLSFETSKHIRKIVFAKFFENTLVLSKIDEYGNDHDSIIVANMNSEQVVNTLVGVHKNIVTCAIATKDGKFIISAGGKEVYDSRNWVDSYTSELYLWNDKGEIIHSFGGYSTIITALAFSPCEKFFVSCDFDGKIKFWDIETKQVISTIFIDEKVKINKVEFSPCGNFIAIASGNSARLFDLKNGCLVRTFEGINDFVTCVKFSPCGKFIFNSNNPSIDIIENWLSLDHKITQYDVDTGDLINEYYGHSHDVNATRYFTRWEISCWCIQLNDWLVEY